MKIGSNKSKEEDKSIMRSVRLWVSRCAYCMFIFSFFLPFVTVQQCSTKEMVSYHGTDLISGFRGLFYLIPMGLFLGYFLLSFFKKRVSESLDAFLQSWKASSAVLSGVIVGYLPNFDYLFHKVFPHIGQIMALTACLLVCLDSLTESAVSLARLIREPQKPHQTIRFPRVMYMIHSGIMILSYVLILLGLVKSRDDIIAVLIILLMSLPFLFSESIVLYSIKRNEKWTYIWSIILLVSIGVSSFFYIFYISNYIIR